MLKYLSIIFLVLTTAQAQEYPPTLGSMAAVVLYEDRVPLPPHPAMQAKDETAYTLADFNGKVTLINFWAPWCAPCRRELPSFAKLQDKYDKEEFQVVIIDVNADGRKNGDRLLSKNPDLSNLLNLYERHATLYRIIGANGIIPITYIIDKNSKLVGYLPGEAQWHGKDTGFLIDHLINETHIN